MALVTDFVCNECGLEKYEVVCSGRICCSCRAAKEKAGRDAHFSYLKSLPLEARISKIEEALYDRDKLDLHELMNRRDGRYA